MATFPAPYCTVDQLLLQEGSLVLPFGFNKASFITSVDREINAKLGQLYTIPLTSNPAFRDVNGNPISDLPQHEKDLIRDISIKMSTGRIYLNLASSEGDRVHDYGLMLIREAQESLAYISSGEVKISALVQTVGPQVGSENRGPGIINRDSQSFTDAWEDNFMRPRGYPPYPGIYPAPSYPGEH